MGVRKKRRKGVKENKEDEEERVEKKGIKYERKSYDMGRKYYKNLSKIRTLIENMILCPPNHSVLLHMCYIFSPKFQQFDQLSIIYEHNFFMVVC